MLRQRSATTLGLVDLSPSSLYPLPICTTDFPSVESWAADATTRVAPKTGTTSVDRNSKFRVDEVLPSESAGEHGEHHQRRAASK